MSKDPGFKSGHLLAKFGLVAAGAIATAAVIAAGVIGFTPPMIQAAHAANSVLGTLDTARMIPEFCGLVAGGGLALGIGGTLGSRFMQAAKGIGDHICSKATPVLDEIATDLRIVSGAVGTWGIGLSGFMTTAMVGATTLTAIAQSNPERSVATLGLAVAGGLVSMAATAFGYKKLHDVLSPVRGLPDDYGDVADESVLSATTEKVIDRFRPKNRPALAAG